MPESLTHAEELLERALTFLEDAHLANDRLPPEDLIKEIKRALHPCSTCGRRGDPEFWRWHYPCDYDPM